MDFAVFLRLQPITRSAVKAIITSTTRTTVHTITLITEPLLTSGVEALVAVIILPTSFTLHYSGRNRSNMEGHCDPPTTDRHEEARQY